MVWRLRSRQAPTLGGAAAPVGLRLYHQDMGTDENEDSDIHDEIDHEPEEASEGQQEERRAFTPDLGLSYQSLFQTPSFADYFSNISAGALASGLAAMNSSSQGAFDSILKSVVKRSSANLSTLGTLDAMLKYVGRVPTLSRSRDYMVPEESDSAYSPELKSAESYFKPTELVIENFNDLHKAITTVIAKTPDIPLVWRGVKNSRWGLHSNLYRHLMTANGVVHPGENPKAVQPFPDEDQMIAAEAEILRVARSDWRFDDLSALETFARIQHVGGPTRLIDVTKNPYVGAWFAVESDEREDDNDARLFAVATRPVAGNDKPPAPDSTLQLDAVGALRDPFWHLLADSEARQKLDWGTGARRRVWIPPSYDPRILAQNAAFLIDGVPIISARTAPYFTIERNKYWRRSDLLASGSIYASMKKPTKKPRYNSRNFAPTFSFRILADAKMEIREVMESRFGYRSSYIYPDMAGLAEHLKSLKLS